MSLTHMRMALDDQRNKLRPRTAHDVSCWRIQSVSPATEIDSNAWHVLRNQGWQADSADGTHSGAAASSPKALQRSSHGPGPGQQRLPVAI